MDNIASVCCSGYHHNAAITSDGSLYMWGYNYAGKLGNGTTEDSHIPIKIMDNVTSVSLTSYNSAAITSDGSLYTWGWNGYGELGNGTTESSTVPIKIMDNVVSASLGWDHSAAITSDGSLYMWGNNYCGQLGNGKSGGFETMYDEGIDSDVPIKIMDNVVSISLGDYHSAAITSDGSLYMWGDNSYDQLGNGVDGGNLPEYDEGIDSNVPIKIMDNVASVSLRQLYSTAITTDGSLYMWGNNDAYHLDDDSYGYSNVPIKFMDDVASICLEAGFSVMITTNGNIYSLFGNLTTNNSYVPFEIEIPSE